MFESSQGNQSKEALKKKKFTPVSSFIFFILFHAIVATDSRRLNVRTRSGSGWGALW